MYAYIDESGDTGRTKKSTKTFIVAAVIVLNEICLPRIARKIFKNKKRNNSSNMLHAHKDTESTHKSILKELSKIKYSFTYTKEKNYLDSLEILFERLSKINVEKVYLAKRDSRKVTLNNIDNLAKKYNLEVVKTSPEVEKGIQITDFISWCVFRKEEFRDDLYFNKILINLQK
jgi:hypothetical protein